MLSVCQGSSSNTTKAAVIMSHWAPHRMIGDTCLQNTRDLFRQSCLFVWASDRPSWPQLAHGNGRAGPIPSRCLKEELISCAFCRKHLRKNPRSLWWPQAPWSPQSCARRSGVGAGLTWAANAACVCPRLGGTERTAKGRNLGKIILLCDFS